jgi:NAD+ synthase (glutamine-hydrolysing)
MSLDGVEIFTNGSGSHHELRKLYTRVDLIKSATGKCGGAYLYSNQQGCDGERVYYDGCALIAVNGAVISQSSQFSLQDIEVITSVIDLDDIRSFRSSIPSRSMQGASEPSYIRIQADITLSEPWTELNRIPTKPITVTYHTPEEEIL